MNLSKSAGVVLVASLVVLLMCVGIHAQNQASGPHSMEAPIIDMPGDPPFSSSLPPERVSRLPEPAPPCRTSRTDTRAVAYRDRAAQCQRVGPRLRKSQPRSQPQVFDWIVQQVAGSRGAGGGARVGCAVEWTQWEYLGETRRTHATSSRPPSTSSSTKSRGGPGRAGNRHH